MKYLFFVKKAIRRIAISILKNFFLLFPIHNNRIVFDNFCGQGFGDNPKYIALYLIEHAPSFEFVWLVNDREDESIISISSLIPVQYKSLKAYYMLATSKIWIDNVRFSKGIRKRKKQFYIQTWHASYSPKMLEAAAEEKIGKSYIKQAKKDGQITDLMISNSKLQTEDMKQNFWYTGSILECGNPRNDYLINHEHDSKEHKIIRMRLGIGEKEKIILFAPTFRDNCALNAYFLDLEQLYKVCSQKYDSSCVILVRLHPNDYKKAKDIKYTDKIINASIYPDMQELLLITDLLITDYSTSIFDAAILKKEIILFTKDIENYVEERGLKDFFWSIPFPRTNKEDELHSFILNYSKLVDNGDVRHFISEYGLFDRGIASETIGKKIMEEVRK